jgi:5-methylcytosine-specific restriction protein A
MALAPPRPCSYPKCPNLDCQEHQVPAWRTLDRLEVPRIRGRELQRRRARLFARERWCRACAQDGRRILATVRDHIVPLAEGGTEDDSNIQPLCLDCSDAKTERESRRGVQRSQMTPRFRKSATPRDSAGHFVTRRQQMIEDARRDARRDTPDDPITRDARNVARVKQLTPRRAR